MKAQDRCRWNFQGDFCRLEKDHEGDTHVGQFTTFKEDSTIIKKTVINHKRNRSFNNVLKVNPLLVQDKPFFKSRLEQAINYFRGRQHDVPQVVTDTEKQTNLTP